MKIIDGGVTSAKGYQATGLHAGIRKGKSKKDMALIYSEVPAVFAGTFTRNKVKAAPVKWGLQLVKTQEKAQAIVVNSGVANACTGEEGMKNCETMAELTAKKLGIQKEEVLVCSTGVIGNQLPMNMVEAGIELLVPELKNDRESATKAAEAIMTTDTQKKEIAVTFEIDGKTVTIGGMCKGSGMIHPNMGTMLAFLTTDLAITKEMLQNALYEDVQDTYNMVSVDGDTSTNDTAYILANGMAGNTIIDCKNEDYKTFVEALHYVNTYLAKRIAEDGEGATKLLEVTVVNAATKEDAKVLSKAVACSNLTKAAMYGKDANWGRIFCAMGYSGAEFNPDTTDITVESEYGSLLLVKDGLATGYDEEVATKILSSAHVICIADVKGGTEKATAWGCDLTHEYVNINADYRS